MLQILILSFQVKTVTPDPESGSPSGTMGGDRGAEDSSRARGGGSQGGRGERGSRGNGGRGGGKRGGRGGNINNVNINIGGMKKGVNNININLGGGGNLRKAAKYMRR